MGKKRKSCGNLEETQKTSKVRNKKTKIELSEESEKPEHDLCMPLENKQTLLKTEEIVQTNTKKSGKNEAIENVAEGSTQEDASILTKNKKKKAKKERKVQPNQTVTENKKIIFNDDEPIEIKTVNKTNRTDLPQEDDVKDEDIDRFCDEIDEEDNKQYENWVQLIEAKLNSNKKKPK